MASGQSQLFIERESSIADKLATEFKNMLNASNLSIKRHQREIQSNHPLFLLIKKHYRIGADIDRAVKVLSDTPLNLVALVVIHVNEPHALPSAMTKDVLSDYKYNDYGLIIDMAFINGEYYDCQMNTYARTHLKEFLQKHSNEKVKPVERNAEVPVAVPVQLYIQPGLNIDLRDTYDRLGDELNLRDSVYQVDAFLHLDKNKPWIVVCEQGHFIQQHIQMVADISDTPKCLLVLNKTEDNWISTWSANNHLLTFELQRDHLNYFLKNYVADNEDIQRFRSMIGGGRTEKQASATKKQNSSCVVL